ncbi:MAG TPA: hypothetical protein VK139_05860 [Microbacteriaceae bacterium]|nr:hypothetical protein [Microbacteriaceae bacterium]
MAAKPTTIEEYLDSLGDVRAETTRAIIESVLSDFPTATVKIAWNFPQIQVDGQYVLGISAAKSWLMLASWSDGFMERFAERLSGYEINKRTFRVPVDWTPDRALLHDLVADRLTELS